MGDLDAQRLQQNEQIKGNIGAFGQLVSSASNDQKKAQFFKSLEEAIGIYNELQNMLHQGSQFYTRLGDILNKMYQNINDFKMSREFEKNDLLSKVGNFQQPS